MSTNINYKNIKILIRNNAINSSNEIKGISDHHLTNLISYIIINLNTVSRYQEDNDIIFAIVKKVFPTANTNFKSFNITIAKKNKKTNEFKFIILISVVLKSNENEDNKSIINFYNLFVNTLYSRLEQKIRKITAASNTNSFYLSCDNEASKKRYKEKQNILKNKLNLYNNVLNIVKSYKI